MKKRLEGFVAGVIATLMLTGVFAFAKEAGEMISVLYNNIKIIIDGENFVATNVNGDVVEPFIYEGTTYLPVRAIATAFDKDVAWDEETYTVSITGKTDNPESNSGQDNDVISAGEYGEKIVAEDLTGTWLGDVSSMLVQFGVPQEIASKYEIVITYEFVSDGTYKTYFSEESITALTEASFEYALASYGLTEEQYQQMAGVSIETVKAQIENSFNLSEITEEGKYRIEDGVLYFTVQGEPEEKINCFFDKGQLTLFVDDTYIILEK